MVSLKKRQRKYIHFLVLISLLFSPITPLLAADGADLAAPVLTRAEQAELDTLVKNIVVDVDTDAIADLARGIETDMRKMQQNATRKRNEVLWSVPASFPEDEFDQQVQDLHVNLPWGRYSFGKGTDQKYQEGVQEVKKAYGIDQPNSIFDNIKSVHDQFQAMGGRAHEDDPVDRRSIFDRVHPSIRSAYAPGLDLYDYLHGKRIIGLGIYRSDIKDAAFLAANMTAGYLLFKDASLAKQDITKATFIKHRDALATLVQKVEDAAEDEVELAKVKKELTDFIKKECALFHYNPLKKEIIWPIIKYILIQRILDSLREKRGAYVNGDPDQQFAFVKGADGEYVRSGVTPISIMSIAKVCLAPVAEFSATTKETLFQAAKSLKFTDRFFGRWHLPIQFYQLFSSVVGEALVLVMALKIMDGFLSSKIVDSIIEHPEEYSLLLQDGKKILSIEYPNNEETESIRAYEDRLEKEIKKAISSGKTAFWSWVEAKRATFLKITQIGFLCFILPSLIFKVAPIVMKLIKS